MQDRLARYKVPKSVEFLEELPISGAGKILKRELRQRFVSERQTRTAKVSVFLGVFPANPRRNRLKTGSDFFGVICASEYSLL